MTERDSFIKVILPHLDHLHARARSMIRDRARTGDLVLQTLIRARERYESGGEKNDVRSWLTNIMEGIWTRKFRDADHPTEPATSRKTSGDSSKPENLEPVEETKEAMSDRLQFEDVRKALLDIPAKYRRILVLAMTENLDESEIADTLELHPATVRMRYARGKRLLKSKLDERENQLEPFRRSLDLE